MKIVIATIIAVFFLMNTTNISAATGHGEYATCFIDQTSPAPKGDCDDTFICRPFTPQSNPNIIVGQCVKQDIQDVFGKIQAPDPLKKLLGTDQTGAGAISQFLSNAVTLIYSIAVIVLIFMFLWAAFEWMTSGGDKEKVASARNKIIYGIIGAILLALAFAIIRIFGQFTGFTFFKNQNIGFEKDIYGNITGIICPDGARLYTTTEDTSKCKDHGG